jgi:hypothetical protein
MDVCQLEAAILLNATQNATHSLFQSKKQKFKAHIKEETAA